jgi:hypothetical protein
MHQPSIAAFEARWLASDDPSLGDAWIAGPFALLIAVAAIVVAVMTVESRLPPEQRIGILEAYYSFP